MADGHAAGNKASHDGHYGKPGAEPLAGLDQEKELQEAERKKDKKYGSDHLKPVENSKGRLPLDPGPSPPI
jgi:hypothetical protein